MSIFLLVLGATTVICGGFVALVTAWRLIPRPPPRADELEAHKRIDELWQAFETFEERHERFRRSADSTIGKLRAKNRRLQERDEPDDDDDEAPDDAPQYVPQLPTADVRSLSRAERWAIFNARRGSAA